MISTVLMKVREITIGDAAEWLRMRRALWPESDHASEIEKYFRRELSPPLAAVFVVERAGDGLIGVLELGLRQYAEG